MANSGTYEQRQSRGIKQICAYMLKFLLTAQVQVKNCDYVVDLDFYNRPNADLLSTTLEPSYSRSKDFEIIYCLPYLDSVQTGFFGRVLWFPYLTSRQWGNYCLLRRKSTA